MRNVKLKKILTILIFALIVYACKDDDKDLTRPEWLQPTIYKTLAANDSFSLVASCIEKSQYKDVLSKSGYYTFFAPNNTAFELYLSKKGMNSIEEIDTSLADSIIGFLMVYCAYTRDKIDDFQSVSNSQWVEDIAFKRRSYFSKWVYSDTLMGQTFYFADQNFVTSSAGSGYISIDRNYKNVSYFTQEYLDNNRILTNDYNYFFPEATFSGFNLFDANVYSTDIICENGIIHCIDKVVEPYPSLEDILKTHPNYSKFREILNRFMDIESNGTISTIYQKTTGQIQDVFIRFYEGIYAPPNCENYYLLEEPYDAQYNGFTMFVPNNEAVQKFMDETFLKYYKTLDVMDEGDVSDFINVHLYQKMVWPSLMSITRNEYGEAPNFDLVTNVDEMIYASNGLFYGVNKVLDASMYNSLWRDILLNPEYKLMKRAIETVGIESEIMNSGNEFTIFFLSNESIQDLGFDYLDGWQLESDLLGTDASSAIKRLIMLHIVPYEQLEDFSGQGLIRTYNGEYIKYKSNFISGAGNLSAPPRVGTQITGSNGLGYILPKAVLYSNLNVGYELSTKFGATKFNKYLEKSDASNSGYLYNLSTYAITNIKSGISYTILVPSDAAMDSAVNDGFLPYLGEGNFTDDENLLVYNFIMYHIIKGAIIAPGLVNNTLDRTTLYKDLEGDVSVVVADLGYNVYFTDKALQTTKIDSLNSNVNTLSNYAIIQPIKNYLRYI